MNKSLNEGDLDAAVALAKAAAPYVHPKPRENREHADIHTMNDEQLNDLCSAGASGARLAGADKK
jgi:hypothetical protein